jgi:hypothetical protein
MKEILGVVENLVNLGAAPPPVLDEEVPADTVDMPKHRRKVSNMSCSVINSPNINRSSTSLSPKQASLVGDNADTHEPKHKYK